MAEEDVEVVRRLLLAYSRGDFPTMLDLIHAEIRVHPRPEEPGVEDVYEGHDGLFAYAGNWMSQWDDYEIEPVSSRPVARSRGSTTPTSRRSRRSGWRANALRVSASAPRPGGRAGA